jgi:hypothetical protein
MHFTSPTQLKFRSTIIFDFLMRKITQFSEFLDIYQTRFEAWVRREIIDDDPWDGISWNVEEEFSQPTSTHAYQPLELEASRGGDRF